MVVIQSVPLQILKPIPHGQEQGSVVLHDVPVDLAGECLIIGVGGEVAIFEHLQPAVCFLGGWDQIFSEGLFQC